jgi:LAS superfamily LD-carboxypeptidase LdcB
LSGPSLDALQLTGRSRDHVIDVPEFGCALHVDVVAPFMRLRAAAARAGIDLVPASGFRDFARQRDIWNAKFNGLRPMQDRDGEVLDASQLTPATRIEAILWWSALPGASRHHWGTDCDVYDRAALPSGVALRLDPDEYAPDGPFAALQAWLMQYAGDYGFFRPYTTRGEGVSPEPWHLSYAPIAEPCADALSVEIMQAAIARGEVAGAEHILPQLSALHRRYVTGYDRPPKNFTA